MPTGSQCKIVVSMCTLEDAAATEKRIGSIEDGHSEKSKAQVGPFGGLLAFFLPIRHAMYERMQMHVGHKLRPPP